MRSRIIALLILATIILASVAVADEAKNRYQQSDPRTEADVQPTETPASAQPGLGEQMTPQLDLVIADIETQYRSRMQSLKSQIASAGSAEDVDALQMQAMDLKVEWTLALANRQLDLARERKDAEAEAELLQAIDRIMHPQPAVHDAVPGSETDPAVEGGAR